GNSAGEQSLAGSRRSDQQYTLGNSSAELLEFLCLAQELDDFFQFLFGFIHAGDIFERHLLLLHGEQAGTALAERKRLIAAGLHLADHYEPERREQNERRKVQQIGRPTVARIVLYGDVHALITEVLDHLRVIGIRSGAETRPTTLVSTVNLAITDDGDFVYVSVVDIL